MSGARVGAALAVLLFVASCSTPDSPQDTTPGQGPERARPGVSPPAPSPERAGAAYVFPVRPPGDATYGREHHDYPATDVFAPCGRTLVAPADGVVQELSRSDAWDPATDRGAQRGGRFVAVVTDDGWRFYGSHLQSLAPGLAPGDRVEAGQRLGRVGRSGNAAATPCHVHVGLSPDCGPDDWRVRRGVVAPWPYLDAWRTGRERSPRTRLAAWRDRHGCAR